VTDSPEHGGNWRAKLRAKLVPRRRVGSAVLAPLAFLTLANDLFGWGLFGLSSRKVLAVVVLFGAIWITLVMPSPTESPDPKKTGRLRSEPEVKE
jgi:hypothetical protein